MYWYGFLDSPLGDFGFACLKLPELEEGQSPIKPY